MTTKPKAATTQEVEAALEDYKPPAAKGRAASPIDLEDLALLSEELVDSLDHVKQSRLIYGLSLLKLRAYLQQTPPNWEQAAPQAQLALKYVQHCENRGLRALQLGRNRSDEVFAKQLDDLRGQVNQVANQKAQLLHRKRTNGEAKQS